MKKILVLSVAVFLFGCAHLSDEEVRTMKIMKDQYGNCYHMFRDKAGLLLRASTAAIPCPSGLDDKKTLRGELVRDDYLNYWVMYPVGSWTSSRRGVRLKQCPENPGNSFSIPKKWGVPE